MSIIVAVAIAFWVGTAVGIFVMAALVAAVLIVRIRQARKPVARDPSWVAGLAHRPDARMEMQSLKGKPHRPSRP